MRFLTHKIVLSLFIFACGAILPALTFETRLVFQESGDLTAILECAIPDKCAGMLQEYSQALSGGKHRGLLDEEAIRRHFQKIEGAELKSYHLYTIPDGRRVHIEVFAKDAKQFLATNALGIVTLSDLPESGLVYFAVPLPKARLLNDQQKQQARELSEIVGGLDILLRIQAPKPLLDTTGKCDGVDRCQWRITLDDIIQGKLPEIQAIWKN